MESALFILILCSILSVLLVLYCLHFRYRAMVMGPEKLKSALSRTVSGEENAPKEEVMEGLRQLESRLRRAFFYSASFLALLIAASVVLTAISIVPALVLALSGVCILMIGVIACLLLLRDILRPLRGYMEGGSDDQ